MIILTILSVYLELISSIPSIEIKHTLFQFRVARGVEFTDVIKEKIDFLIPLTDPDIVKAYPDIFQPAREWQSILILLMFG